MSDIGVMSVTLGAEPVSDSDIHYHKKYVVTLSTSADTVYLPQGEFFHTSLTFAYGSTVQDSVQVYIDGILQTNGINFIELTNPLAPAQGIGVFFTETLMAGDVVTLEWSVRKIA
jgi:hypothetical protein